MPFDLLMLLGKDVRLWPLDERRDQLREIVPTLSDTIRYSETFNVPLSELMRAVRKRQLERVVAKRAGSQYRCGERSPDRVRPFEAGPQNPHSVYEPTAPERCPRQERSLVRFRVKD